MTIEGQAIPTRYQLPEMGEATIDGEPLHDDEDIFLETGSVDKPTGQSKGSGRDSSSVAPSSSID